MIYIDNANQKYGRMIMCHMIADSKKELLEMVNKIGVNRKWIQKEGTYQEHFDICQEKKRLAIQFGAKEITCKELGIKCLNRKVLSPSPDENKNLGKWKMM